MKKHFTALFLCSFCIIKITLALPSLQSFSITPTSVFHNDSLFVSELTQTNINFSFIISRPMVGTSFENENIKVSLEYESPQGTIIPLSSEYSFASADFLEGGGSLLSKSLPASIPPNSIGGKVYLKIFYNASSTPTRLPSSFYYTKKGTDVDYHNGKFVKSLTSGKLYIQMPYSADKNIFYYIYSHDTFVKIFNESAVINSTISIQGEPQPNTDPFTGSFNYPLYFDGTYDAIGKTFLPALTFLAQDTHTPGDKRIYLVQKVGIQDRYICRLVSEEAISNYHFNKNNMKKIDMNVRDGNSGTNFKYYNYPGMDLLK